MPALPGGSLGTLLQQRYCKQLPVRLLALKKKEKAQAVARDLVFLTEMYKLKTLLSKVFAPPADPNAPNEHQVQPRSKPAVQQNNLGGAVARASRKLPHGPYTNTEILEVAGRARIAVQNLLEFVIPGRNRQHPVLDDLLSRLQVKEGLLSGRPSKSAVGIERILPMIRSDGTLALLQMKIDSEYAAAIKRLLLELETRAGNQRRALKVLVEGVDIASNDLLEIFSCLVESPGEQQQKPHVGSTSPAHGLLQRSLQ